MHRSHYFDYASTTPVDKAVIQEMLGCLSQDGIFGNASSDSHREGLIAKNRIEVEREKVAKILQAEPEEILWTSGATESNNLAILGIARANQKKGRHLITSALEHKSVLEAFFQLQKEGFELTILEPNTQGIVTCDSLQRALRDDTILVSIMMVNNEIGTIQPIAEMGDLLKNRTAYFHVDAVQAAGKLELNVQDLKVDALTLSAHKIYGPKGSGMLYVRQRPRVPLFPLFFGGGQESKFRPGTLATHQIVGFSKAFEMAENNRAQEVIKLKQQKERLWSGIQALGSVVINGDFQYSCPHILNVSFEGVDGEALIMALQGFSVSSGSACTSGSIEPSHVLQAIGRSAILSHSAIRFSWGRYTTDLEIEALIQAVKKEVTRLRNLSPLWQQSPQPFGFKLKESKPRM